MAGFVYSLLLHQLGQNHVSVEMDRRPGLDLKIENVAHVVAKSFHNKIRHLGDHPHVIF